MTNCIADTESWCRYRGLKLNTDKSEVLWLGTRQQIAIVAQSSRQAAGARNLGVYTDEQLTFNVHARACASTIFDKSGALSTSRH